MEASSEKTERIGYSQGGKGKSDEKAEDCLGDTGDCVKDRGYPDGYLEKGDRDQGGQEKGRRH